MTDDAAARARAEQLARAGGTAWFEQLYAESAGDPGNVPWADLTAHPALREWLASQGPDELSTRTALVIGCGLGDDAAELAARGARVTAFDISPTAIDWARRRWAGTVDVDWVVADLTDPPPAWAGAFDLVVEIYTLQPLQGDTRAAALTKPRSFVAPGGRLLVISRVRDDDAPAPALPWPLTDTELAIVTAGLEPADVLTWFDEAAEVRRVRGVWVRPA